MPTCYRKHTFDDMSKQIRNEVLFFLLSLLKKGCASSAKMLQCMGPQRKCKKSLETKECHKTNNALHGNISYDSDGSEFAGEKPVGQVQQLGCLRKSPDWFQQINRDREGIRQPNSRATRMTIMVSRPCTFFHFVDFCFDRLFLGRWFLHLFQKFLDER